MIHLWLGFDLGNVLFYARLDCHLGGLCFMVQLNSFAVCLSSFAENKADNATEVVMLTSNNGHSFYIQPSQAHVRVAGIQDRTPYANGKVTDIIIDESALRAVQAHALSKPHLEVAGVLVGTWPQKQQNGRFLVHITDMVVAKYAIGNRGSITLYPESWRYMTDTLHARYPNETTVIVGWYHTHPNLGIFLSEADLFIDKQFFTQEWQIALVLDACRREADFFSWNKSQTQVRNYSFSWPEWVGDSW